MIQVKVINPLLRYKDLEEEVNDFLRKLPQDKVRSVEYSRNEYFDLEDREVKQTFSAMIVYETSDLPK